MRYLDGGVASGFKHVDPDHVEKKLLQVKGKRNVRVRQVTDNYKTLRFKSFNILSIRFLQGPARCFFDEQR